MNTEKNKKSEAGTKTCLAQILDLIPGGMNHIAAAYQA